MADRQGGGVLLAEHELLGACLGTGAGACAAVSRYAGEKSIGEALEGVLLADLTGAAYLLVSGDGVPTFARAALAGRELGVGELDHEAALAGDGSVVSVPLALRTGPTELVLLDASSHAGPLIDWVERLCGMRDQEGRLVLGARSEDASALLVCLLLVGRAATRVLSDYVRAPERLPEPGHAAQVHLDAIGCLVANLGSSDSEGDAYLTLVPPQAARRVWRSLLSFAEVAPVGLDAIRELASRRAWGRLLEPGKMTFADADELASWGLLRDGGGYVGARELLRRGPRHAGGESR